MLELHLDWRHSQVTTHGVVRDAGDEVDAGRDVEKDSVGPALAQRATEEDYAHEAEERAQCVVVLARC